MSQWQEPNPRVEGAPPGRVPPPLAACRLAQLGGRPGHLVSATCVRVAVRQAPHNDDDYVFGGPPTVNSPHVSSHVIRREHNHDHDYHDHYDNHPCTRARLVRLVLAPPGGHVVL